MENFGRCKSSRLGRESDGEEPLSHYTCFSCPVCGQPELWEGDVLPRVGEPGFS